MPNNNHDLNQVLQACLEAIQSGEETVGSVLARYPEFEEQLRPQIEAANWLLENKEAFNPRPEFVSASRQRLMAQIKQGRVAPAPPPRPSFWENLLNLARSPQVVRLALALILLVVMLFGSSQAVLASQNTIPGDTFYPVKITYERIQLLVTLSDTGDAQLHTRFAQRRLLEMQELVLENRYEYIVDSVEAYEVHVNGAIRALRQLAQRNPVQAERIATQLEQVLTSQNNLLAILSESVPADTHVQLQRAMDISQAGVVEVTEIRLTAIAQITATPTPTPTFTHTPSDTSTGPAIAVLTETASPAPTATSSGTPASGTLVVTSTPVVSGDVTATPGATKTQAPLTGPTATATPKAQPTEDQPPAASPTPTDTHPAPSATPTATQPGVTQPSPTPTATSQPGPTSTWTPSPTPLPPTDTPQPPPPTDTPVPPTNTPVPPPPTNTPVAPACDIDANIPAPTGNKVDVNIHNHGAVSITLTSLTIEWPPFNEELKEVQMGGATIWSGSANSSPTTISDWSGSPSRREISAAGNGSIRFIFKRAAEPTGYNLSIQFDNGCSVIARR